MNKPNWKEHIKLPSLVGAPEEECPIFIGPEPSMEARRGYMGAYLPWATGFGTREWLDANRPAAERLTAKVYADHEIESLGQNRWEFLVDATLWNMAFGTAGYRERPAFPWEQPPDTAGGESETYMRLKTYRRAEVEADEFLDRLGQRLVHADSEAQAGRGPEAQG